MLQVIADESRLEVLPFEFEGRGIQHPLFSMVRWYLKSRGAICFTTGMKLRKNTGSKYQLELDHIFPYSKLKEVGYGLGNRVKYALAQELTNRAILTQVANRSKSASPAADYLASVKTKFPKALELQCLPQDENLWKVENYKQFRWAVARSCAPQFRGVVMAFRAAALPSLQASGSNLVAEIDEWLMDDQDRNRIPN